ncbi:MAG: tetratricopeptide repeat protein [Candidatus Omnitrophica bacterium]|nr:tetratricopeptide repeat protein [Candidatus Omnitrophota bacterium]MCA9429948.1 tetratricopeptide repeat protein [Candidatus Omnitrophota bacterium]MCA9442091.1 tetratricopeptide repeat protein [Candidatus Omnitrophota bacterium]MCB9784366.1 tetratricopeptide repeat protein [Candidatus Omnitrophota bacterium]
MGIRLIRSLLLLLASILIPVLVVVGIPVLGPYLGVPICIGLLGLFLHQLVRFFQREDALEFAIPDQRVSIEFWNVGDGKEKFQDLFKQVLTRRETVQKPLERVDQETIGGTPFNPGLYFVNGLFLFSIPALILEEPLLFGLCLIPILRDSSRMVKYYRMDPLFRMAYQAIRRDDPQRAVELLEKLLSESPGHIDARKFLFGGYLSTEEFQKASDLLSSISNDLDSATLQAAQEDLILAMRIAERKKI